MKIGHNIFVLFLSIASLIMCEGAFVEGTNAQDAEIQYSTRSLKSRPYRLDSGDTLGVFLEGVLGKVNSAPPVYYPPAGSGLAPAMGFPIVVRENGCVSLPLVGPVPVRGLTLLQAEEKIRSVYFGNNKTGQRILNETSRIIVTLQRKRTVSVIVIRQDNSRSMSPQNAFRRGSVNSRSDRSARSSTIQLPADQSDLLHALLETGGLPGLNAKPEARIYRAQPKQSVGHPSSNSVDEFPRTGAIGSSNSFATSGANSTYRIPLGDSNSGLGGRGAGLNNGDIVLVESKPTEVYYTSGLLRGGEHPIPRDKSLNVLEAVALSGGPITRTATGFGISQLPPTELSIIRNNPQYGQSNIRVDLNQAIRDPSQRILVVPGDHLILQYKKAERIGNFGINTMNTHGLRRLFQSR